MTSSKPDNTMAIVKVDYLVPLFLWAIAIVLVFRFFDSLRIIVLGFLAACIAAAALRPVKRLFPGPRWWSAALTTLLPALIIILLIILLSWLLSGPIYQEVARLPELGDEINRQLAFWSTRLDLEEPITLESLVLQLSRFLGQELAVTTATILFYAVLAVIFVFFGSLFLLGEKPGHLISPLRAILPAPRRAQLEAAIGNLEPRLRWWLLGTMISMTTVGVVSYIGYRTVGLRFAGPVALVAGLSEIVPTFGPTFAFLFALLFAAAQDRAVVIGVVAVYLVIQALEGNVLTPYVMKKAVDIPPVVTLFTVLLWSFILGVPGLILAIPINMVIWTLFDHFLLRPREAGQIHPLEDSPSVQ